MDLIKKYQKLKLNEITLCQRILRVMNYKTFRALESDDFVVDNFSLPVYVVKNLNKIYKHKVYNNDSKDYNYYYYNKVRNIVDNYINNLKKINLIIITK